MSDPAQRPAQRVPARWTEQAGWDTVTCRLCPHLCSVAPSRSGACGVRTNRNGVMYLESWGRVAAMDLVEAADLPLLHDDPVAWWLLVGMQGCNMRCPFCNTASFSQLGAVRTRFLQPTEIVAQARARNAAGIAFGINEPLIALEYVLDVFALARASNLQTALITNGAISPEPLDDALPLIDQMVVGLKGFRNEFLSQECGGDLGVQKSTILTAVSRDVPVEVTYFFHDTTPGWEDQIAQLGEWLGGIKTDIPLTLMSYEPAFTWNRPGPLPQSLDRARDILRQFLRHVFIKDRDNPRMDTSCAQCGRTLVRRGVAGTILSHAPGGNCPSCGTPVPYRRLPPLDSSRFTTSELD